MRRWTDPGIVIFEILSIAVIVLVGWGLNDLSNTLRQAEEERFYMMRYADQLRHSSDNLTRFARSYVVTGDERFRQSYFDVLHIRHGTLARPQRYYGPYWDLSEQQRAQRHPAGRQVSLKALMAKWPYTEEERALLDQAEHNSDELVGLEVEAFNAMTGHYKDANGSYTVRRAPDRQWAVALLYSPEYYRAKDRIMTPVDTFITTLDARTKAHVSAIKGEERVYFAFLFVLIALYIAGNGVIYLVLRARTVELVRLLATFDKHVIASKTDRDGVITYVSNAFAKASGYEAAELIGKRHRIIRHADTPAGFYAALWESIGAGKTWEGEVKNRRKDGTAYWVRLVISPEYSLGGKWVGYSAVGQDITAQKGLEELSRTLEQRVAMRTRELAESREFVQTLLDTQQQIIITTDGKHITSANQAFVNFYGRSLEAFKQEYECICNTFDDNVPEGYLHEQMDHESWIDYLLLHAERTNKAQITQKGTAYVFSITAARLPREADALILVVLTDITELERAQTQIREAGERLQMAYEIGNLGWWDWRVKSGRLYTNEIFYTMLGYTSNEFAQNFQAWVGLLHPDDVPHVRETIGKLTSGEVSRARDSYRYRGANGEWIWIDNQSKVVEYDEQGKAVRLLGINTNIDKNKRLADSLAASNKKISDSIEYASLLQHALIPPHEIFERFFADYFVLWEPRDVVGGDIYFAEQLSEHEIIVMVVDCTGHGVPGAFVTMLVKAIERQIVATIINSRKAVSPAAFLAVFNRQMRRLLRQEGDAAVANAGFDAGVLYYDDRTDVVRFAGAKIPIFIVKEGRVEVIRGDRHSIGYTTSNPDFVFTDHEIDVEEGTTLYMATDGYLDQNGGARGLPFGKKRFTGLLPQSSGLTMAEQKSVLVDALASYRGGEESTDDVTVLGMRLKRSAADADWAEAGPVVLDFSADGSGSVSGAEENTRILFSYRGTMTQPLIAGMVESLEKEIDAYGWGKGLSVNLVTVFIELAQNIMRYAKAEHPADGGTSYGEIIVGAQRDGGCCISSRNFVDAKDHRIILQRLAQIEGCDREELRLLYRTWRKEGDHLQGGSAGIGFAEIARRCARMEYAFKPTGSGRYYFTLKTIINC